MLIFMKAFEIHSAIIQQFDSGQIDLVSIIGISRHKSPHFVTDKCQFVFTVKKGCGREFIEEVHPEFPEDKIFTVKILDETLAEILKSSSIKEIK